jgi:hypothetical protein
MRRWLPFLIVLLAMSVPAAAAPAALPVVAPVISCHDLVQTDLTAIGGAGSKIVRAGETTHDGVAVCAVEGQLAPTVGFVVYLPTKTWTQRYLQIGCGGLCGNIPRQVGAADGCVPLTDGGFAIAGTDMGHASRGGEFARDLQKRADFAYRGVHVTALAAKALIKAFYGRPQAYAYFSGCSDGGREALVEAQRYPADFNGILAGAAAMNFEVQNSLYHGWQGRADIGADGKPILLASRLPLLHRAVLAACDDLDGLKDGLITDPRICNFDPASLQCPNPDTSDDPACLSTADVAVVRKLYDGPRDAATGTRLTVGGPQFGSELAWAGLFVPAAASGVPSSQGMALDALRNIIFETNPPDGYAVTDLKFDLATFARLRPHHPLLDATNPDLSAFAAAGGKLILWHGWADQHISPFNTIAYHLAVETVMGKTRAESFERLYLLPGVYHCGGGEGPSQIDFLTPVMAWVERGLVPQGVVAHSASRKSGPSSFGQPPRGDKTAKADAKPPMMPMMPEAPAIIRSRPVYPYPAVAVYNGYGDPNAATSFHLGAPLGADAVPPWAGSDFYRPYMPRER